MQTTDLQAASLSKQQERAWKWLQANQIYGTQGMFLLQGTFELDKFQQALQQSIQQYEILRTTFAVMPGMELPVQILGQHREISCLLTNLQCLETSEQQNALAQQWRNLLHQPFDLEHGPLLYAVLCRLDKEQHVFILRASALCADASTIQYFCEEVLQRYRALLQDNIFQNEEDALQYIDVTAWRDDLLHAEGASEQQDFWRTFDLSHLDSIRLPLQSGKMSQLPIQTEMASPAIPQQVAITLEPTWQERLEALCQEKDVSQETFLLTCWQILLWRLTGESPFTGVTCTGRPYEELTLALGPYTHTVPFSLSLDREISLEQALAETSSAVQQMNEKQLYFNWEVTAPACPTEKQFFPLGFAYTEWPEQWQQNNITMRVQKVESWDEPTHLQLYATCIDTRLQLQIRYQPTALSHIDAHRLAGLYHTLLQNAITTPQAQVSSLELLTQQEQVIQREHWRGQQRDWPFVPLHHRFQAYAQRQPDAPALRYDTHLLTYQQLDHLSSQLAHLLLAHGLPSAGRVAIYQTRDHWAIVSLLAVLKAGACYVPLDEDLPAARVRLILDTLSPDIVLSQQSLMQSLNLQQASVLLLEDLPDLLAPLPVTPPPAKIAPEQLAYIMYTSGSTGTPKGVLISHSSVSNYTDALLELLQPEAGWHFATVSSLAADLGNTAVFTALSAGGCLHVLPYTLVTNGAAMARYTQSYPLDVLKIVPSHLQALLDTEAVVSLPRQRLILGGEALPWSLVEQLHHLGATCQLYNHYGPTEATIGTLVNPLGSLADLSLPALDARGYSVPLGDPLPNAQICLLDAHQHQVPAGVVGELYIAGAGLAAGYLNAPDLTQEVFVHVPSLDERIRWYRTGDLVRENEYGQLEFVGRRDSQVKVRGYRIELGEIEAHLRSYPGVREAVVHPWQQELIGYLLAWKQAGPNPQEIREELLKTLPSYLVPSRLIMLDQLPLTANGKVDRRRLPAPDLTTEQEQPARSNPPRTPIEEVLAGIWQEVLGLNHLGRDDDFFMLGGHSLLGTRVIARLQTIFGREIPITWLFDAPTVAALAERIEEALRKEQRAEAPALVAVSHQQPLPLSFAQQRLWFLDQLEPGNSTYTVPIAGWLRGPLNAHALEQSLVAVIDRHEVLRTTFALYENLPVQIIHPSDLIPITWVDLTTLPESERTHHASQLVAQEIRRPFDLQRGPLLRIHLLRCSSQEQVLLLTMHHAVSDAWSHAIWLHELHTFYTGFVKGAPAQLSALPLQYADYALWQRSWLQGEVLQQQLDYWMQQLSGLSPLELPTDHPRPAHQSFNGAVHSLVLSQSLNTALKQLSQRHGTTLFMTLLAAFQVLLARSSGQDDIAVGTPIANRGHKEIEELIGFFTNTLVMRGDLSGDPTFVELLTRVRRVALEAYTHQEVPFEQVVEALQPERDLSRSPLFQVLFQLQHAAPSNEDLADLSLDNFVREGVTAKFDLTLALFDNGQELRSTIEYNRDLFEPATIQRWLEHWQLLLEGLVDNPEQRISQYTLLTQQERQTWLEINATRQTFPGDLCLHELFAEQANQHPDAIAVTFEDEHLSYATLNKLANRLAYRLREAGVKPDMAVGLCAERSLHMVIGLLGILKAGGAYVPLDPAYPQSRLEQIIAQAGISALVTQVSLQAQLISTPVTTLYIEECLRTSVRADQLVTTRCSPQQLAYVIYTSGSTGVPKGVSLTHQGLVNLMHWQRARSAMGLHNRTLQFTSISFDVSCQEFFATWSTGGCLVLIDQQKRQDTQQLLQYLRIQGIERIFLPFIALHQLVHVAQEYAEPLPSSLREVITAGEQVQVSHSLTAFFKHLPQCRLDNQYGPSETHVVTAYQLPEEPDAWAALPPIGAAISNCETYILDEQLQLVPIGVAGELYLGGVALARGYWRSADLTAERFIPHPFSQEPGARLYRTGDRARTRADGTLEFMGRRDDQIKVRGYRIELLEIEAVISAHPAVSAAAIGVQNTAGEGIADKRLVAYIVRKPEQPLSLRDLRSFVGERLPQYMLPAALIELERLPLSSSGKVNRRQLPAPQVEEMQGSQTEGQEPRNELEELVLQIWKQVLQTEQPGVQDNFFEIGGHSLLATQVVSRLRQLVGVELPVRAIFEAPTVAQLATLLTHELQREQGFDVPEIVPMPRNQNLPLSFTQQRLWFMNLLEPDSTAYSIPIAVRLGGQMDRIALNKALSALIQRHENLRTTFPSQDGQPIQLIDSQPTPQLVIIDLSHLAQEERESVARQMARQEAEQPFNLAHGPLFRSRLLQLAEQEDHALLLTMHHIISDGWSLSILIRELTSLYTAFSQEQPVSLPALPVQYADYALWQRSWLQGEVLQRQLDYWKQQLAGVVPLELPIDHPRPPIQTFRGARLHLQLPHELHQQLRKLSQQEGVTLFMTLLASFQVLLARYSGQEDIAVGTTIANRTHQEIEGLIGCFINMLVLRVNLSDNPSFIELLAQVRTVALQAYSYQDLPFEQVVEALQPQRDLSRSPLFQALFVMQNLPPATEEEQTAPMESENIASEQQVAKLELSVMVVERGQRLNITLGYNTDLFETSTIQRLLAHWQRIMEAIVAAPEQRVALIPLFTPAEREQMLRQQHTTQSNASSNSSSLYLHELFEAQVERTPDATAIVLDETHLTYRALNQRANQLAHTLQRQGVKPEERVGIYLERSLEMVIGVLAVLKAGGAYVPLDPTAPRARVIRLLQEVRPSLILVSETSRLQLPSSPAKVLFIEREIASLAAGATENPQVQITPDNLAYIVHTSGSTGRPKGIMIAHRGVTNYLHYLSQTYHLGGDSVVLQLPSLTFDASVRDIFGTLTTGAKLVLLHSDEFKEPTAILRQIERHQVTAILSIVPSLLRMLLETAQEMRGTYASLQLLLASGEPLFLADYQKVASVISPETRLINQYGPTECTMTSTYYTLDLASYERETVLAGKPIPGMQVYILDHALNLVPPGIQGDVYLSGPGIARSYLNQAEITAERFLPHPWSTEPGERLYQTGDIAHYLPDGNIELSGRSDHQVKIRGNRVELGEIEAALSWHPQVRQSVILIQGAESQEIQIVAYVVMEDVEDAADARGELRSFLQERLPDYMLPAHFVLLAALPLTPNGKVDRRALASLKPDNESARFVQFRDAIEYQLCDIWSELLNKRPISVMDNFFDLGGHSILAVRMMSHIKRTFNRDLPLATLFQRQTVAELAILLREQLPREEDTTVLVPFQIHGDRIPFFCIHPSGGEVFEYRNLSRYIGTRQPFYGMRMPDPRKHQEEFRTLEGIALYYIAAIKEVQPQGPYQIGGWSAGGQIAYELAQQLQKQGEEVRLLALIDSKPPKPDERREIDREKGADDATIARSLMRRYQVTLPEELASQGDPVTQLIYVSEQLKQRDVAPRDVSLEQIRFFAHVQDTIERAIGHYIPQPYTGPVTLFRAKEDEVQAPGKRLNEWQTLAEQIEVHLVPGNHITMIEEPDVKDLAASLARCLDPEH
ncbi:non-ribosomal peptide synthetase [Dictyobacter arantiisoli]|uniref:Carrier domain-containing protein n=1 Tax=Dictyobacter arantiisoli TaxID=2014874 RepID=A0A5A5TAU1_9CHLR|nr:non-ribosomal peptide synthetase [Dictyobacter arantiisoli]GCF08365.1 hypothetical protein KDI_19290 [Dictyobacter arantiisoli]